MYNNIFFDSQPTYYWPDHNRTPLSPPPPPPPPPFLGSRVGLAWGFRPCGWKEGGAAGTGVGGWCLR